MKLSLAVIATAIQDFEKRSVFPCFHIYNDNDNDYTDDGSSVFSEIVSILRLLSFPWDPAFIQGDVVQTLARNDRQMSASVTNVKGDSFFAHIWDHFQPFPYQQ